MPLYLPPLKRRKFLSGAAYAAAGFLSFQGKGQGAEKRKAIKESAGRRVDPNYLVLLSDTHIDQNPHRIMRGRITPPRMLGEEISEEEEKPTEWTKGVNPAENLHLAVERIVASDPLPGAVIINGDGANTKGLPGEYGLLSWLLRPLSSAGIPIYMTMGNHDRRPMFGQMMEGIQKEEKLLEDTHLGIFELPNAWIYLLDSLITDETPGRFGEDQLKWLDESLKTHNDKPAILFAHHPPHSEFMPLSRTNLQDWEPFYAILQSHEHVKAYLYGHSHRWAVGKTSENIHLVNQPTTAHVFQENQTQAYLHARVAKKGMKIEFDCLDREHPWHGETHELAWR